MGKGVGKIVPTLHPSDIMQQCCDFKIRMTNCIIRCECFLVYVKQKDSLYQEAEKNRFCVHFCKNQRNEVRNRCGSVVDVQRKRKNRKKKKKKASKAH